MLTNLSPLLITVLAFIAVATAVFVIGQFVAVQMRVRQRVAAQGSGFEAAPGFAASIDALVTGFFDEKRFGVEGSVRAKLRRELVRAGFFRVEAINYYIFFRLVTVIVLPTAAYLVVAYFLGDSDWYIRLGLVAFITFLAVLGPDAYIARRTRKLQADYRIAFPDMLDLMVVCVDAGLSLEAALDRISGEITRQNRYLGANLLILGSETRAGRSTVDALASFADRVGLDEARSFVAVLRQSIELGTDVGDALRVFSDEMRDRRLLRAETRANELPVKMVGPLGLCIFPVILGLVLLPVVIRLFAALGTV